MSLHLRRGGQSVLSLWHGEFFLSIPVEEGQSFPAILRDQVYFVGLVTILPAANKGWLLLLKFEGAHGKTSPTLSIFCEGYLYYKRTLRPGAQIMHEIEATLRYMGKYSIEDPRIVYVSEEDMGLTHSRLKIQRLNCNSNTIEYLGGKNLPTLPKLLSPLTEAYLPDAMTHGLRRLFVKCITPLFLCATCLYIGIFSLYAPQKLISLEEKNSALQKTLLPPELMHAMRAVSGNPLVLVENYIKKIAENEQTHALPHKISLDHEKGEATLHFSRVPPSSKNMANVKILKNTILLKKNIQPPKGTDIKDTSP